jgi:very-short-patch-repair endonuclease
VTANSKASSSCASQHLESDKDARRDKVLDALGYRVIRIWNNDVLTNIDGVLEMLLSELRK